MKMLSLLRTFYSTYLNCRAKNSLRPPPTNFFDPAKDHEYREFLMHTIELANTAVFVDEISDCDIQRSPYNTEFFV